MYRDSRRDLETRSSSSLGFIKAVKNGQNGKGLQAIKDDPKIPEKHMGIHSNKKDYLCHRQLFRGISQEFISSVMAVSNLTSPSDIPKKWMAKVPLLSPMICCGIHATAQNASTYTIPHENSGVFGGGRRGLLFWGVSFNTKDK